MLIEMLFLLHVDLQTFLLHVKLQKTISGKRNHFALKSGCAMTIYMSQGSIYNEIMHEYNKTSSVICRFISRNKYRRLFICTRNDDSRFYHGRRIDTSVLSLQEVSRRLSFNRLNTLQEVITDFVVSRHTLSILSLSC